MRFYFVTNDKWYSKAHRLMTKEPITHIGLAFCLGKFNLVVDCTAPCGKVYHLNYWLTKYTQIRSVLELKMNEEKEENIVVNSMNASVNVPYDWGAYYYAWLMGLRKYLFGTPYPKKNKWSGKGMLCTEIIRPIEKELSEYGFDFSGIDLAATTPYMLYEMIKDNPFLVEINED